MSKLLAALICQEVFLPEITTYQCNWITWKYRAVG